MCRTLARLLKSRMLRLVCLTDFIFKHSFMHILTREKMPACHMQCTACPSVTSACRLLLILHDCFAVAVSVYSSHSLIFSLTSLFFDMPFYRCRQFDNICDFDEQDLVHFLQICLDCQKGLILFLFMRDTMLALISEWLLMSTWHPQADFRQPLFF